MHSCKAAGGWLTYIDFRRRAGVSSIDTVFAAVDTSLLHIDRQFGLQPVFIDF